MNSFRHIIALIAVLSLGFLSCDKRTGVDKSSNSGDSRTYSNTESSQLEKKIRAAFPNTITNYEAKADLNYADDYQNIQASANLVWKKDAYLWVVVKKFGFEAVRAMVTPDSVFVLNRLNQTYMARSTAWLAQTYQVPGGFELLPHLLFGQAYLPNSSVFEASQDSNAVMLRGKSGPYRMEYNFEHGGLELKQALFALQTESQYLGAAFLERKDFNRNALPQRIQAETYSPEHGKTAIGLKLRDIQLNSNREVSFSIPTHYKSI